MHLISSARNTDEIFAFCERWLLCLSQRDFGSACGMILPDGQRRWTPEILERLITNYGHMEPRPSGRRCAVTAPDSAAGVPNLVRLRVDDDDDVCTGQVHPRYPFAVYWFLDGPSRNGASGWLHLDYPLDGKWSELSSIFKIVPQADQYGLALERIEVM